MDDPDKKPNGAPGKEPGEDQADSARSEDKLCEGSRAAEDKPAAKTPPARVAGGEEPGVELEASPELQSALEEAIKSCEKLEQKKKEKDEAPKQSEAELKLKVEIIDLKHRVRQLEAELEKKVKELRQNFEQGMALKGQFEAYKSRVMKEKAEAFNYGHEPLLKDLLPVLDNFERALAHAQKSGDPASMCQGVELILRQLLQLLEKYGVKQLQSLHQTFDPNYHQAMTKVTSADHPDNTVVEEHNKGYLLKDRLLRPAMVTICRNPESEKKPAPADGTTQDQAATAAPDATKNGNHDKIK